MDKSEVTENIPREIEQGKSKGKISKGTNNRVTFDYFRSNGTIIQGEIEKIKELDVMARPISFDKEKALELYKADKRAKDIAIELNASYETIKKFVQRQREIEGKNSNGKNQGEIERENQSREIEREKPKGKSDGENNSVANNNVANTNVANDNVANTDSNVDSNTDVANNSVANEVVNNSVANDNVNNSNVNNADLSLYDIVVAIGKLRGMNEHQLIDYILQVYDQRNGDGETETVQESNQQEVLDDEELEEKAIADGKAWEQKEQEEEQKTKAPVNEYRKNYVDEVSNSIRAQRERKQAELQEQIRKDEETLARMKQEQQDQGSNETEQEARDKKLVNAYLVMLSFFTYFSNLYPTTRGKYGRTLDIIANASSYARGKNQSFFDTLHDKAMSKRYTEQQLEKAYDYFKEASPAWNDEVIKAIIPGMERYYANEREELREWEAFD